MSTKAAHTRERILAAAETIVLRQGFAGTPLDDILKATRLTKGAFFHHFKGKADLAAALLERYRTNHQALFDRFATEADASSDNPLDALMAFLIRFERFIEARTTPLAGCVLAAYSHESRQFDAAVNALVTQSLRHWTRIYAGDFDSVLARHKPIIAVTSAELAEMLVAIIEGGLILSRSYGDAQLVARQSRQFRNYLMLLFADRGPQPARRE